MLLAILKQAIIQCKEQRLTSGALNAISIIILLALYNSNRSPIITIMFKLKLRYFTKANIISENTPKKIFQRVAPLIERAELILSDAQFCSPTKKTKHD